MKTAILLLFLTTSWAMPTHVDRASQRIVNGALASEGEYPFAVGIIYYLSGNTFFCGGSLLTDEWIITAAHCIESAEKFRIILGSDNVLQPNSDAVQIEAFRYIIHPQYDPKTLKFDIGFVQLQDKITFSDKVKPIDYLSSEQYLPYRTVVALGWGMNHDDDKTLPDLLYHVTVTTIANAECMRTYGHFVADHMICTVGKSNEGICEGDSGGPLIEVSNDKTFTLVGIASFFSTRGCNTTDPSGFIRISNFVDWIKETTGFTDNVEEDDNTDDEIDNEDNNNDDDDENNDDDNEDDGNNNEDEDDGNNNEDEDDKNDEDIGNNDEDIVDDDNDNDNTIDDDDNTNNNEGNNNTNSTSQLSSAKQIYSVIFFILLFCKTIG